ncbi:hypothetical protein CERSUDRAFT_119041 [Gelatoporia subvermispora B]|uniref:Uncharacterized protein n=1 Tax=Ceriporiopsis subvermispora (strain B) TaxID=914234 RepID=M2QIV9_CERS8|nr:hypothetical protein CERSUDRAFT_119041 [Gelatoporia subvermispora B]
MRRKITTCRGSNTAKHRRSAPWASKLTGSFPGKMLIITRRSGTCSFIATCTEQAAICARSRSPEVQHGEGMMTYSQSMFQSSHAAIPP